MLVGLIGGTSWESTAEYYRLLNRGVSAQQGQLHSAEFILYNFDFQRLLDLNQEQVGLALLAAGQALKGGGVQALMLLSNTMHRFASLLEQGTGLPLIHIADAVGREAERMHVHRLGLLGTRFTMEHDFYRQTLAARFGLETMTPEPVDRAEVHRIIFEELCAGRFMDQARERCLAMIQNLAAQGAQAVILGCTELPLLLKDARASVPLLDTTRLHAESALQWLTASSTNRVANPTIRG